MTDAASDRPDLGAALHRLTQEVIRRELPLLAEHGLEMWEYAVLSALGSGPAPTQAQLADQVGRDATRLIPILDRLQARRLVDRTPAPHDRRNRVVTLLPVGRELLAAARASIRAMEDDLLAAVPAERRRTFREVLDQLAAR